MSVDITSNYITCHMIGRLGNQMFQIANAYAQSLRHNRQLLLPKSDTSVSDYFDTVHRKLQFLLDKSPVDQPNIHTIHATYHYTEYKPHNTMPTVFKGYFESEKYFIDYKDKIKELFEPTKEFLNEAYREYPQLINGTTAAINVRRGDFLTFPKSHPVISLNYIYKAVDLLPKVDTIFVLSDDIYWCKDNIKIPNAVFVPYSTYKALWFLSLCQHFVISNSTFSWWGAYLSKHLTKTVIAPGVWFGPDILSHTEPKDIYCDSWIKASAVYDLSGFILPG